MQNLTQNKFRRRVTIEDLGLLGDRVNKEFNRKSMQITTHLKKCILDQWDPVCFFIGLIEMLFELLKKILRKTLSKVKCLAWPIVFTREAF